jgi:cytochrome b involved in lipid metabolism
MAGLGSLGMARADAPGCGVPGSACSEAEVATHNTVRNCWVIYSGAYYAAGSFVGANGAAAVLSSGWCGRDVTVYVDGLTSAKPLVKDILASYRVGPVQ